MARYFQVSVPIDLDTGPKLNRLAKLLSIERGVKVDKGEAVHLAICETIDRMLRKSGKTR
jgi:hypothetical protein